ncbi:BatD family protein [Hydrogenovibrio marinus]|nr:BatD family protein [Hydrogenovibrio marinus]
MAMRFVQPYSNMAARMLLAVAVLMTLFTLNAYASDKTLSVSTDRQKVEMGDVMDLVVQTNFQTFDDLDLSPLKDQFKVLGTQRSTNVSIVNGNYQALTRWDISITPKQIGELMIPPLTVDGIDSQPYKLSVSPMTQAGKQGVSFLESSISTHKAYVQQQVIYTLKYYHLGRFIDGSIRPPIFKDAINKQLKNQVNYQKDINGQRYEVYEWSWAFYPQKSGTLTIPPEQFDGRLQYRGAIKMIRNNSKPITLTIMPQNANYPKDKTWLPTPNLTLTQDWQMPNSLRVGDSITRTIRLQAQNLMSSQLPDISLEDQAGFHVYPDDPKLSDQEVDSGINSAKTVKMAIVPLEAGKITLPSITINWWNTQTEKMETATLPAKTLDVLPALKPRTNLTPLTPQNKPVNQEVSHETSDKVLGTARLWQGITAAFALLWLMTAVLYWRERQKKVSVGPNLMTSMDGTGQSANAQRLHPSLEHICTLSMEGNAKGVYQAFNQWSQEFPVKAQAFLAINENASLLNRLKGHLFHQEALDKNLLPSFCQALKASENQQTKESKQQEGRQLDPIYPE